MDLPPLEVTDAELLRRTAAGDADAFSQLYDRTSRVLFALARQILRNDTAAEDLLQDVYVQVWDRAGSFDASLGRPITWLMTLTRNRAVDRLRSSQRFERMIEAVQGETELAGGAFENEPEMHADRRQMIQGRLERAVGRATTGVGHGVLWRAESGGIAEKLNVPLGTIKARMRRGMMQMRDALMRSELKE
jgi:RNA polymerase sigma-70 factor (ECF subfamily)